MSALSRWVQTNVKWLLPFLGAIAAAVKPILVGGDYSLGQVLFALSLALGAYVTWVAPNVEAGVAKYTKGFVVVALAGIGAAQNVLPGGITRADLWTVGTAIVAALGTIALPTTQVRAVIASGYGQMGDEQLDTPPTAAPAAS